MFKIIVNTAHDLLINTVFFIMAMAVLSGAFSSLLSEFGVIELLNDVFKVFMRPLYNLPGASITGVLATYLSDNPAIISFSKDRNFTKYFKKYEIPALCNLGTSFGMGLVVTTFMISQGDEYILPAIIGNIGSIIGSIVSVRNIITPNDIAVFTAMGMYFSGYLSTHVGMMDTLGARSLTTKAIISHTIGGIVAGITSHSLLFFRFYRFCSILTN